MVYNKRDCEQERSSPSENMETTTTVESSYETHSNRSWTVPYLIFLLIVGTIGNSCGLFLFVHSSMRKYSCSLHFFLLAVFDELSIVFWTINRLSRELTSVQLRDRSSVTCKIYAFVYYSASQASIGMLVLAMFDRLYTSYKIAHGYFDFRMLSRRRQRCQRVCLASFFALLTGFNGILFGSQLIPIDDDGSQTCVVIDLYVNRIYSLIDLGTYAVLPFLLMLTGDIAILYYIQQTRARVTTSNTTRTRKERQLSMMLVITSIVSLFIVSPYSFLNLLINFTLILADDDRTLAMLHDAFGLLSTSTHALHFYLFLIISGTIRKQFVNVVKSYASRYSMTTNIVHPMIVSTIIQRTTGGLHDTISRQSS